MPWTPFAGGRAADEDLRRSAHAELRRSPRSPEATRVPSSAGSAGVGPLQRGSHPAPGPRSTSMGGYSGRWLWQPSERRACTRGWRGSPSRSATGRQPAWSRQARRSVAMPGVRRSSVSVPAPDLSGNGGDGRSSTMLPCCWRPDRQAVVESPHHVHHRTSPGACHEHLLTTSVGKGSILSTDDDDQ